MYNRVLITGAGGALGKMLREGLRGVYPILRLSHRRDVGPAEEGEEINVANLENFDEVDAAMEGVDVIAFTGGIGENGFRERAAICRGLGWLGVRLDPKANESAVGIESRLSASDSSVEVWSCPTNEEWIVAREVSQLIRRGDSS